MKKKLSIFLSIWLMFCAIWVSIILMAVFLSWLWSLIVPILWGISILWTIVIIMSKNRRFETRVRWTVFIITVPIIGIISYIFFGQKYKFNTNKEYKYKNFADFATSRDRETSRQTMELLDEDVPQYKRSFVLGNNLQNDLVYDKTHVDLLPNGSDFIVSLIKDVKNAKDYILLNFYILKEGEITANLFELFKKKVGEGVKIYIIHDWAGSYTDFSKQKQKELILYGIKIVAFAPLNLPWINWTANYRDHRKDISIDGKVAYVGGNNISDEYVNLSTKFGFWNDAHVRITGSAVQGVEKIFASDWNFTSFDKKNATNQITDYEPNVGKRHPLKTESTDLVQIISSGPNHETPMHFDLMMGLISSAQKRIWISTPYFVPPVEMINALSTAAKSGVDVRIVLPGKTDKPFILDVSKRWTRRLFEAGVRIYSMNNTFNHTKAYLFDDDISFIGSTNLDFRAFFTDQQTMALIKSNNFNKALETRFIWDYTKSFEYTFLPNNELKWYKRVLVACFNIISPLL